MQALEPIAEKCPACGYILSPETGECLQCGYKHCQFCTEATSAPHVADA